MLVRLIIPLGILVVLVGIAMLGWNSPPPPERIPPIMFCEKAKIETGDIGPANILFLGSSRTGAAIDTEYLQEVLANNGKPLRAQAITVLRSEHTFLLYLFDEYVEKNGVPDTVYLEHMLTTRGADLDRQYKTNALIEASVTTKKAVPYSFVSELQNTISKHHSNPSNRFLRGDYTSAAEYISDRFVYSVYDSLSRPKTAFSSTTAYCSRVSRDPEVERLFNTGHVSSEAKLSNALRMTEERKAASLNEIADFQPDNIEDPRRSYDKTITQAMITQIKSRGVKTVNVIHYPDIRMNAEESLQAQMNAAYLDADKIVRDDLLHILGDVDFDLLFYNQNHVNVFGAKLITDYIADEVVKVD